MAAANRLVKAGVTFIVLESRSCSGGRTHAFKFGHESAGQHVLDQGTNLMQGTDVVEKDKDPPMIRMSSLLGLAKPEGLQTVYISGATDDGVSPLQGLR